MDHTRPTPTGNVEATPEAGPLTPPTMRDNYAGPLPHQPTTPAGAPTAPETTGHAESRPTGGPGAAGHERGADEIARDLGERLKPVVSAAEDVATKALDLSAKGLSRLVDKLEDRRRHRDDTETS